MGREVERKFLVRSDAWKGLGPGSLYRQGYICTDKDRTVRVRLVEGETEGSTECPRAFLALKGQQHGMSRHEFEYEIPVSDARFMLEHMAQQPLIEKYRYRIPFGGLVWEVDEFLGANAGLVTAEVELENEAQRFSSPVWIGQEVTADARYANSNLVRSPYNTWQSGVSTDIRQD